LAREWRKTGCKDTILLCKSDKLVVGKPGVDLDLIAGNGNTLGSQVVIKALSFSRDKKGGLLLN
jgi:hypothetical protein